MATLGPVSRRLRELFAVLDADENGFVTWADHRRIVETYAAGYRLAGDDPRIVALEKAYWRQWLALLGRAKPGRERLSEEEFVAAHRSAGYDGDGARLLEDLARALFEVLDTDGDRRISAEEFARYLEVWGIEEADGPVFRGLDLDRDDYVSQAEILRSLRAFHLYNDDLKTPGGIFLGVY